jgi:hypothetical protein
VSIAQGANLLSSDDRRINRCEQLSILDRFGKKIDRASFMA